jgi:hypothetical protein
VAFVEAVELFDALEGGQGFVGHSRYIGRLVIG